MATSVLMPQLGESVVEGTVGKWLKQVGDRVELYEPILEVVTDKVTTEIPSPAAGTLLDILVPEGTTVRAGTVLAHVGQPEETAQAQHTIVPAGAVPSSTQSSQPAPAEASQGEPSARMRLTPVVARMIAEHNITSAELATIRGTGEHGRISKKDIERYIQTRAAMHAAKAPAPWEQPGSGVLFRSPEEIEREAVTEKTPASAAEGAPLPVGAPAKEGDELIPLSPIRRAIAEHMVRSKHTAPHVTTVHEAEMTRVLAHFAAHKDEFQRQGIKLTYTPYFVQAVAHGLQTVPMVNAQFTEQGILLRKDINIGVAVSVEEGLIVPVIKAAAEKSLLGLARAVNDLAARAREKKLSPDDVTGGTFTITNYGVFGSLFGTPVISQPQSAILGVGSIQKRVVVIDDAIAIRPMVYLALSFDHRLLDGALADGFMNAVKSYLENYPA